MKLTYPDIALQVPRIILPGPDVTLDRWAVIACDQHTSSPDYWNEVGELVGDSPSTLSLVFPEVFLEESDRSDRIAAINQTMRAYLAAGLLKEQAPGFVLVDRKTPHAASRKGLLVCLDLEQYSYEAPAETLIRTTEGTDPERLPPRVAIRRDAPLELPHIMVLIDDPRRTVIEPLFEGRTELPPLYDFDLMMGGGHLRGWPVADENAILQVVEGLTALGAADRFAQRYRLPDATAPMLYALGDGNHSFATAQRVWQELREDPATPDDHPARYPLVELVNLHDDGLTFEPIHRVVFDTNPQQLLSSLSDFVRSQGSELEVRDFPDRQQWERARVDLEDGSEHHLPFIADDRCGIATIHHPQQQLAVASLQNFLSDDTTPRHVDYIHGTETVDELGSRPGNVGFYCQVIDKGALFRTILLDGPLPRKSFSLGEAEEKRYYLESRRLTL